MKALDQSERGDSTERRHIINIIKHIIMYNKQTSRYKTVSINKSYQGETIEQKIQRIVNNKEPIKDGAPLVYTDRKDGVKPEHDIRTDRFEIAVEAMDKITKSNRAKRESKPDTIGEQMKEGMKKEGNTGGESIQGT